MKFRIRCRKVGDTGEGWWENYDKPTTDPNQWAKECIEQFNMTLRPNESPREVLEVATVGPSEYDLHEAHDWGEKENLVTVQGRDGSLYDTYRCQKCGTTGKRFGVEERIVPDNPSKAYKYCDTARKQFAINERMKVAMAKKVAEREMKDVPFQATQTQVDKVLHTPHPFTCEVIQVDQSPVNAVRWCVLLSCGHEMWVTRKSRPTCKVMVCDKCSGFA